MLDAKSMVYGAIKYGGAVFTFTRDRAYYKVAYEGEVITWLTLDELRWLSKDMKISLEIAGE